MKILVVDDEKVIVKGIKYNLEQEGYQVSCAYDGEEAVNLAKDSSIDLILLDVMLPKMDGLTACRTIRGFSDVPIIMLTARSEDIDKILGLEYGADDYITKPFNIQELLARITVQLRQHKNISHHNRMTYHDITLDTDIHTLSVNGENVKLTRTEYAILKLLMQRPEQVVAKLTILESISIDTPDCTEDSLKIHIHNLRKKLKTVNGKDYISAVWGIGFMLSEKN